MLRIRLRQIRMIVWLSIFKLLGIFIKQKHWVICERSNEARDNGYSFYQYMKKTHPEQKVYYIITKNSVDYKKVEKDAVVFNTIKSFWIIASARKIISAHYASVLLPLEGAKVFRLFKLYQKFYFLQHGVIKDDLKVLYADNAPMRLFVCGAKPEYEDIKENYGHPKGVVRYTGLARFDELHNVESKRQILIMPTWRTFIKSEEEFISSEYFERWKTILHDGRIHEILQEKKINLYFYPHYEMQAYVESFKSMSDRVIIATAENYDVQKLLRESSLLVTDYSSVFFDFAYMKKPVLYYHFDQYHYKKGYFDYQKMGFGPVCTKHEELVDNIIKAIDEGFIMDNFYKNRANKFFPLYDTKNCERIYHAIMEN